jgi:hypothetical protein
MRPQDRWKHLKGILSTNAQLVITGLMRTGIIYIDGQHIDYQFSLGDQLIVRQSNSSLNAFVSPKVNEIFK